MKKRFTYPQLFSRLLGACSIGLFIFNFRRQSDCRIKLGCMFLAQVG